MYYICSASADQSSSQADWPKAESRNFKAKFNAHRKVQTLIIFSGSASECIAMLLCNYSNVYPSEKFGILLIITYLD